MNIRKKRHEIDSRLFQKFVRPSFAIAAFVGLFGNAVMAKTQNSMIIDDVNIVDVHDGAILRGSQIEIQDGKIVAISRAGQPPISKDAVRISAAGKYVVPGYNDMHAHPVLNDYPQHLKLPLFVAYGVTGVRVMIAPVRELERRMSGTMDLPPVSPEILQIAGPPILASTAPTPAAAVAAVRWQKDHGAELIKVVEGGPVEYEAGAFLAAVDEARSLGLPVGIHMPATMSVDEAITHGVTTIEHLGPDGSLLLSCSTQEGALRAEYQKLRNPYFSMHDGAHDTPTLMLSAPYFALLQRVIDTYDEKKCQRLARKIAGSDVWQTPTLIRAKTSYILNDADTWGDENFKYVPADVLKHWQSLLPRYRQVNPADQQTMAQLYALMLRITGIFAENGVKMVTGSDFAGAWLVPGYSLHQEFALLKQAGVSPLKVLQMSTLDAAQQLGREGSMGSVEVGKAADLVFLDANPVEDSVNLSHIHAVVRGGIYYSNDAIAKIKSDLLLDLKKYDSHAH